MRTVFWLIFIGAILYWVYPPATDEMNKFGRAVSRKLHAWENEK